MAILKFTSANLTYAGKQISVDNKVPIREGFIVSIGISLEQSEVISFIPKGSTGFIDVNGNRFICRKDDVNG